MHGKRGKKERKRGKILKMKKKRGAVTITIVLIMLFLKSLKADQVIFKGALEQKSFLPINACFKKKIELRLKSNIL